MILFYNMTDRMILLKLQSTSPLLSSGSIRALMLWLVDLSPVTCRQNSTLLITSLACLCVFLRMTSVSQINDFFVEIFDLISATKSFKNLIVFVDCIDFPSQKKSKNTRKSQT